MPHEHADPAARLVTAQGAPARPAGDRRCPRCQAGPERRVASAGFGDPHPVCSKCGFEFDGERWHG